MKRILLALIFIISCVMNVYSQSCGTPRSTSFGTTQKTATSARPDWAAVSGALSYNVEYRIRNVGASYSAPINTVNKYIVLTNLQPSTNYEFIVQTVCSSGLSAFSSSGWFTTTASTGGGGGTCGIPNINLFGTDQKTSTSARPYWSAVSGAISYNLQYRIRNVGASYSASLNTTNTFLVVSGLQPSTNYEFIVQTVCATGLGSFSSSGWFTTLAGTTTTCGTPSSLTTSSVTNTSALLSWPALANATGYNVRHKATSSSTWINATSSDIQETLTGLQPGTTYECQVQTVCSAGSSSFSTSYNFTTTGGVTPTVVPQFAHIVVVIGENTKASSVYGRSSAPYINSLLSAGVKFTNSYGITHPSQPNYLHLFSGSNQGVTDNNVPSSHFTTSNLAKELLNAGKTFIHYSDGLPSVGYDGSSSGSYRRRHNAIANWMGSGTNQVPSTLNQPFTSFPTNFNNLPSVSFIAPDLCNDGHDACAPYNDRVKQYDAWIENNLDAYKQWCVNNNSLLIITYDEDDGSAANNIATVFYGANVVSGTYPQGINHHNILRFIEDANGLTTHAGSAANVSTIDFCWTPSVARNNISTTINKSQLAEVYPNPFSTEININFKEEGNVIVNVFNQVGEQMLHKEYLDKKPNDVITISKTELLHQASGLYFVKVIINDKTQIFRMIME